MFRLAGSNLILDCFSVNAFLRCQVLDGSNFTKWIYCSFLFDEWGSLSTTLDKAVSRQQLDDPTDDQSTITVQCIVNTRMVNCHPLRVLLVLEWYNLHLTNWSVSSARSRSETGVLELLMSSLTNIDYNIIWLSNPLETLLMILKKPKCHVQAHVYTWATFWVFCSWKTAYKITEHQ